MSEVEPSDVSTPTNIASHTFRVSVDGSAGAVGKQYKRCVFGRASTCDIVIKETLCSRRHAEIYFEEDNPVVCDLDSKMGTYVNGVQLFPRRAFIVESGDVISICGCRFVFSLDGKVPSRDNLHNAPAAAKVSADPQGGDVHSVSPTGSRVTFRTEQKRDAQQPHDGGDAASKRPPTRPNVESILKTMDVCGETLVLSSKAAHEKLDKILHILNAKFADKGPSEPIVERCASQLSTQTSVLLRLRDMPDYAVKYILAHYNDIDAASRCSRLRCALPGERPSEEKALAVATPLFHLHVLIRQREPAAKAQDALDAYRALLRVWDIDLDKVVVYATSNVA